VSVPSSYRESAGAPAADAPRRRGVTAWIVVATLVGASLGAGVHFFSPESDGTDFVSAPDPTLSRTDEGILPTLDWHPASEKAPEVQGWEPEAEDGWTGIALEAGDLWALESVAGDESTGLYLVGPEGRRIALMGIPVKITTIVGWDHDAGIVYGTGYSSEEVVIDLVENRWAYLPIQPAWETDDGGGPNVSLVGTTADGRPIWWVTGAASVFGTWDWRSGWDVIPVLGVPSLQGPGVPSDWVAVTFEYDDPVTVVNVVTHEQVTLPGTYQDWNLGTGFGAWVGWLDADTIARPPTGSVPWTAGSVGWTVYDAPTFDVGRIISEEESPLSWRERLSSFQYPGTPLVATCDDIATSRVSALSVLTTDGLREIVDLMGSDAAVLEAYVAPLEPRTGLYVFDRGYEGLLVVDVVTGEVYDYGITATYPRDGNGRVFVAHAVYVVPDGSSETDATTD
jgi:hypothetical protein